MNHRNISKSYIKILLPFTFPTVLLCITVFMDKTCRTGTSGYGLGGLGSVRLMFEFTNLHDLSNLINSKLTVSTFITKFLKVQNAVKMKYCKD